MVNKINYRMCALGSLTESYNTRYRNNFTLLLTKDNCYVYIDGVEKDITENFNYMVRQCARDLIDEDIAWRRYKDKQFYGG